MNQWLLIGEFRRRLLLRWNILGSIILLLLLLQSVFGQYTGMIADIWLWIGFVLLPGWVLLFLSAWLNKFPARLVPKSTARSMSWLHLAYLLLILLTILLSQAAIDISGGSLRTFFRQSIWWLGPLNGLLIAGVALVFYRKEMRKRPNAKIIQETALEQAKKAAGKGRVLQQQCLELVADGRLDEALQLLEAQVESEADIRNQVVLLRSQLAELQRERDLGLIQDDAAQLRLNRLAMATLNMSDSVL